MKSRHNPALKKLLSRPLFYAKEARALGVHPSRLAYYVKIHLIERIGRGVYRGVESEMDLDFQWEELVLMANSVSSGVVCLISALTLYGLTEEIPRVYWIAIPHATTAPKRENVRFVRMRDMRTGVIDFTIGKEQIRIFNIERTIVDAFRYLSLEVGIKALKLAVGSKHKIDLRKLRKYAKKFRINIDPYILSVTT